MAKHTEKFDPNEVPGLLEKAQGIPQFSYLSFKTIIPTGICTLDTLSPELPNDVSVRRIGTTLTILGSAVSKLYVNEALLNGEHELKHDDLISFKKRTLVLERVPDIIARDELLYRFQRLIATLVNVCITGRPNFWSSYQKTFLRMFSGKDVPIQNTASMLKRELSGYEKEELFSTGQLAVLLAIERCESNLATTIVICFKDLIHKMIKDPSSKLNIDINECALYTYDNKAEEDSLALDIFISSLNSEEQQTVHNILNEQKISISALPSALSTKFKMYLKDVY